jgi:hypothetical protein
MFRQILRAQWLAARLAVVILGVLAFAAPLLAVFWGGDLRSAGSDQVAYWLQGSERIAALLPYLALLVGVTAGFLAWSPDHAGRHVYALSLPVSRARFVALRFGAGAVITAVPALALLAGAIVASLSVSLPEGLHAYPVQLTLRFLLASLTLYAIIFALSISTKRAQLLTAGALGGVILADLLLAAWGVSFSVTAETLVLLTTWPGPLSILAGAWTLFDV